ncbi:hypothetical protein B0H14DRAFT_3444807 [Mycena olivaceomarginata]|nr:hypothetical protein B0H14DRAFT_3444807 [Mycena olivaceomarginata]
MSAEELDTLAPSELNARPSSHPHRKTPSATSQVAFNPSASSLGRLGRSRSHSWSRIHASRASTATSTLTVYHTPSSFAGASEVWHSAESSESGAHGPGVPTTADPWRVSDATLMSAGAASAQSVSPYATATKNGTEVPGAWSSMRVGENSAGEWEGDTEAEADPSSSVLSPLPYPTALPLWCGRIHVPAYTTATPAPAPDFTASASASGFGESPPQRGSQNQMSPPQRPLARKILVIFVHARRSTRIRRHRDRVKGESTLGRPLRPVPEVSE